MARFLTASLVALGLLAAAGGGQDAVAAPDLRTVIVGHLDALNRADVTAAMAYYHDDAESVGTASCLTPCKKAGIEAVTSARFSASRCPTITVRRSGAATAPWPSPAAASNPSATSEAIRNLATSVSLTANSPRKRRNHSDESPRNKPTELIRASLERGSLA